MKTILLLMLGASLAFGQTNAPKPFPQYRVVDGQLYQPEASAKWRYVDVTGFNIRGEGSRPGMWSLIGKSHDPSLIQKAVTVVNVPPDPNRIAKTRGARQGILTVSSGSYRVILISSKTNYNQLMQVQSINELYDFGVPDGYTKTTLTPMEKRKAGPPDVIVRQHSR